MQKRKKIIKFISYSLGSCLILYLVIETVISGREFGKALNDVLPTLNIITSEDSSLISNKYRPLLTPNLVFQCKNREPVSIIYYDSNYYIFIYKIIPIKNATFRNIFNVNIKSSDPTTGEIYSNYQPGNAAFHYLTKPTKPARKIYLALEGDSIENTVKNDTALNYHLICKSLSIKYDEQEPFDLVMTGKDNGFGFISGIPIDLLFLDRNNVIYLLVMIPEKAKTSITSNFLFNIVSGEINN